METSTKLAVSTRRPLRRSVVLGAAIGLAVSLSMTPVAHAAMSSGNKGCPGNIGWSEIQSTGYTTATAPGGIYLHEMPGGGYNQRPAWLIDGTPKLNGGPYTTYASTITLNAPDCRNYG